MYVQCFCKIINRFLFLCNGEILLLLIVSLPLFSFNLPYCSFNLPYLFCLVFVGLTYLNKCTQYCDTYILHSATNHTHIKSNIFYSSNFSFKQMKIIFQVHILKPALLYFRLVTNTYILKIGDPRKKYNKLLTLTIKYG